MNLERAPALRSSPGRYPGDVVRPHPGDDVHGGLAVPADLRRPSRGGVRSLVAAALRRRLLLARPLVLVGDRRLPLAHAALAVARAGHAGGRRFAQGARRPDRRPDANPQRGPGAGLCRAAGHLRVAPVCRRPRGVRVLHPQRQHRTRRLDRGGSRLAPALPTGAGRRAHLLSQAAAQHRAQGRQYRRLLQALGRRATTI